MGIALLIAALACWIGFHLVLIDDRIRGWELWKQLWAILTRGSLPPWESMIAISAFLMIAVLVSSSPFVAPLLRTPRLCHWLAILASGAALLGLGDQILEAYSITPGLAFLSAAMVLNFVGLICLRPIRFEKGTDPI